MSLHFLIVDDSELNLKVVDTLLKKSGITADLFTSVTEAYKAVQRKTYDLILLDYLMPGINGIEAAKHIREMSGGAHEDDYYAHIPIFAFTAENDVTRIQAMRAAGINGILEKPMRLADLHRIIDKWCTSDDEPAPTIYGISSGKLSEMLALDKKGYLDTLGVFSADIRAKHDRINSAIANKDFDTYTVELHRIKGEARIIGAEQLASEAERLESCGKALSGTTPNCFSFEENVAALSEDTPFLLGELDKLNEDIQKLLSENGADFPGMDPSTCSPQHNEYIDKVKRYTQHALEALSEGDYKLTKEWLDGIIELLP